MTLDQIRTLCCIVETGTLKQAAEQLHKTQPALSMALKKLESEYGFEILNRDSYRVSLTEEGKLFYRKSKDLIRSASQLNSLGKHLGAGCESKIRLGYESTYPAPIVMQVLKKCQSEFPNTEFQIIGSSRFGPLDLLKKNKVDIAISPWWPTFYGIGDFDSFAISNFRIVLAAAPHLFTNNKPSVDELKSNVNLVVEHSDLSFDTEELTIIKGCRKWTTLDTQSLKQMLLAGLGWGYIPEGMIIEELKLGTLMTLEPEELEYSIEGEIRMVRRQEFTLGPVAAVMWEEFNKHNLGLT